MSSTGQGRCALRMEEGGGCGARERCRFFSFFHNTERYEKARCRRAKPATLLLLPLFVYLVRSALSA